MMNTMSQTQAFKADLTRSDSNIFFVPDVTALDITVGDVGNNVICSYSNPPAVLNVTWLKGETQVLEATSGDVFQISASSSTRLYFSQTVKRSDTGTYTCRFFTNSLTTANKDLYVNVKETCDATPVNGMTNCTEVVNITTVCSINCLDGYYLDFPKLSTCASQDNWQPDISTSCKPITCVDAPDLEFGKEKTDCTSTDNSYMETCALLCNDGYYISGDLEAPCQDININNDTNANGEWNTTNTKCLAITCTDVPVLEFGKATMGCTTTNNSYLDKCELMCDDGYYISGDLEASCQDININNDTNAVGQWNTNSTECIAITCVDSPTLTNGAPVNDCSYSSYLDACDLICNDGYFLSGFSNATCIDINVGNDTNEVGFWDTENTECIAITCIDAPVLEFGKEATNCTENALMDKCDLMCNDGYYISGDLEATCQDSNINDDTNKYGKWNTSSTNCIALTCIGLPSLINGVSATDCSLASYLDTCDLTCNDGYFLFGLLNATCIDVNVGNDTNQVGLWDAENTECIAITCIDPPVLEFGKEATDCANNSYTDKCGLMCNDGYYISGDLEASCQDTNINDDTNKNGQWDTKNTNCTAITCLGLPSLTNGVSAPDCNPSSYPDTCELTCNDGYFLSGDTKAACIDLNVGNDTNQNGRWDTENTECITITCVDPPDLEFGKQAANCTTTNNSHMDICELMCNDGYYISGDLEATCQDTNTNDDTNMNGKWTITNTKCTAITCLESPSLTNGHSANDCSSANYLETCNLVCDDGYAMSGNPEATCIDKNTDNDLNQFGQWSIENAKCIEYFCTLELPEHGLSNCQETVSLNTSCTFECENGFSAIGDEERICEDAGESNGVWSVGWESASCERDETTKAPIETTEPSVESSTVVIVSSLAGVLGILLIVSFGFSIYYYKELKSVRKKGSNYEAIDLTNENAREHEDIDQTSLHSDVEISKSSPEEKRKSEGVSL